MTNKLKPCPFCGGKAAINEIQFGVNRGGSCVECTKCQASTNIDFGFKENFVSNWNRRTTQDELIQTIVNVITQWEVLPGGQIYNTRDIGKWLTDQMAPAINQCRQIADKYKDVEDEDEDDPECL